MAANEIIEKQNHLDSPTSETHIAEETEEISSSSDKHNKQQYDRKETSISILTGSSNNNEPIDENGGDNVEDSGDGTKGSDQILHGMPLLLCSLALLLCMFLISLDQTIVVTLLETVGNKFGDFGKINWIASGFLLPMAVLSMSWGKISLIFGRKYTMLVAVVLFEIGSLVCALANSMNMLIGGRVLAGIGASGVQVLVFVILTEIVTIEKRGIAQSLIAVAFAFASVIGPLVGGAFTAHVTWRWCFYLNLPFGVIAFACLFWFFNPPIPAGTIKEKLLRIDYIGTGLLTSGLVLVLLAPTLGSVNTPWNSAIIISFFVVGGIILIVFAIYNFGFSNNQLVPWAIIRVWRVDVVCFAYFAVYGAFYAAALYLATFFQIVLNASAMQSGIDLLPMIIPVVVVSAASGVFISKTGITKPLAVAGAVLASIGYGLCSMFDQNTSDGKKIGYLIIAGVGVGLSFQALTLNCQTAAPKKNGGVLLATAIVIFARSIGGVIGSTIGQTIQNVVFRSQLEKLDLPPSIDITQLVNAPQVIRQLPIEFQQPVLDAFVFGFRRVMYFTVALQVAAFITELFFTNKRIPKDKPPTPSPPQGTKETEV